MVGLLLALALLVVKIRSRADRVKHGMDNEPTVFFAVKNLAFAAMIVAFSYLLSSYKGLPNGLVVMLLLMLAYDFATSQTTIRRRNNHPPAKPGVFNIVSRSKRLNGVANAAPTLGATDSVAAYLHSPSCSRRSSSRS